MNRFYEYFAAVSKIAAARQGRKWQQGVKLGYNQYPPNNTALKFTSNTVHIGTDDFSVEFWGNTYGSAGFYNPTIFFNLAGADQFSISTQPAGNNGVYWISFGRDVNGGTGLDPLFPYWEAPSEEGMFHCVVTRSGTLVKCFIEGEQKAQKTQTMLHDFGDVTFGVANSSNMGFVRVWNYALSASEVTTLYNNGNPAGYVLPAEFKSREQRCIAEYLPQNIVADNNGIASSWLDSAKQLPLNGEYLPPLLETVGGYDMTAKGAPEVIYPESDLWYGIEWNVTQSASSCIRIGDMSLHRSLPIQSRMRGCLLDDNGDVIEYLAPSDWTGAARDGSRGQVMVEIPRHYRKHETEGDIRRTKISEYPLPGYHVVPKMYISAYEAAMERSTGKLCSVVNAGADYRGGNNQSDWDGTYRSLLGRPVTVKSRTAFRNAARLRNVSATSEWNCLDYNAYKAVFWLYYVEYADRNCQLAFNPQKNADGFAQGGLGNGVTNMVDWTGYNGVYPFVPCGHTDELGNGTGEVAYPVINEDGSTRCTVMVPRYRGVENPFGHIWQWTDGINIRISPTEENGGDGLSKVFVCSDPSSYKDNGYDGYTYVGNEVRENGYVKEVIWGECGDVMPAVVGGDPTAYWEDYHYTNIPSSGIVLRGGLFGGAAFSGATAGFSSAHSAYAPSNTNTNIGSRLCFIPKK